MLFCFRANQTYLVNVVNKCCKYKYATGVICSDLGV